MGTITVTNLGKAYKQYPTRWSRLREWLVPFSKPRHQLHWVLRDIHFTVNPGEAVGIIGINGAGKSTLLKMITGTTQPTTGSVNITGRVAALLELGMGFHPDFTGRQNAYMAGQLLGMSVEEIAGLMPEIEAFAEIGDYMDQPVRVYSSGMQMRVAFSVATARRPDVLIVDEALSVGDAYFQHKSFDRIRRFRNAGTTLLLVSHDKQVIQTICDRAVLLNGGRIEAIGDPEEVLDFYNAMLTTSPLNDIRRVESGDKASTISGTGEASIEEVVLCNAEGKPVEHIGVGELVELRISVSVNAQIETLVMGFGFKDRLGQVVYGTNTWYTDQIITKPDIGQKYIFHVKFISTIGAGHYSVQVALVDQKSHLSANYEWRDRALMFEVINSDKPFFMGSAWLDATISIE
jgi:lipopolysaccharide transport system ATP-binding protein